MKLKNVIKFQQGGEMAPQNPDAAPVEGGAPTEGGSPEDMLMQIAETAMQALQNQDCEAAMAVCQAFVQMVQSQGGGAESEPIYSKGGKLVRRIRK